MAITSAKVTVGATATALTAVGQKGKQVVVRNAHATDALDLGDSGVTAGSAFRLAAGTTVTVTLQPGEQLFGIRTGASDNADVYVLRTGA
jgi:hypothetical protein